MAWEAAETASSFIPAEKFFLIDFLKTVQQRYYWSLCSIVPHRFAALNIIMNAYTIEERRES